jgi:hypothetical protein
MARLRHAREMKITLLVLLLTSARITEARDISGQVFIVTKGSENIKLGLVEVEAFDAEAVADAIKAADASTKKEREALTEFEVKVEEVATLLEKNEERDGKTDYNGKTYYHNTTWDARELVDHGKQRLAYLSSLLFYSRSFPAPLASVKTDADGHFDLSVPDDKPITLCAHSRRLVGDSYETYDWIVPISKDSKRVNLSNDNLCGDASSASILGSEYTVEKLKADAEKLSDAIRAQKGPMRDVAQGDISTPAQNGTPPEIITLIVATEIRVRYGKTTIPRGTRLPLVRRQGNQILASYNGETVTIPEAAVSP